MWETIEAWLCPAVEWADRERDKLWLKLQGYFKNFAEMDFIPYKALSLPNPHHKTLNTINKRPSLP
jgi:hypothetical protein